MVVRRVGEDPWSEGPIVLEGITLPKLKEPYVYWTGLSEILYTIDVCQSDVEIVAIYYDHSRQRWMWKYAKDYDTGTGVAWRVGKATPNTILRILTLHRMGIADEH